MPNTLPTITSDHSATTTDAPATMVMLNDGASTPLGREIGAGGFGTVHACSVGTQSAVVKILRLDPDDPRWTSAHERLRTEEGCLRALDVPAVPRLLGTGSVDERPCILMEHVEGHSWRSLLKAMPERRFPWHLLLRTGHACARTLEGIHDADIAHGDIKPENLLLGRSRQSARSLDAWIIDFGMARRMTSEETRLTMEGQMLGTHGYMDPTILWSADLRSDASDVFALGATFYETWKGRPLFPTDIWRRVLSHPDEARTHIHGALHERKRFERRYAALLFAMLHHEPERRPGCHDIRRDLRALGGDRRMDAPKEHEHLPHYIEQLCGRENRTTRRIIGLMTAGVIGIGSLLAVTNNDRLQSVADPVPTQTKAADAPSPRPSYPSFDTLMQKPRTEALRSTTIAESHSAHVIPLTTQELCALLEEGKPGTSVGLPKRTQYPGTLYVLRPNADDEESLLQLTRGCFYKRGNVVAFYGLSDLRSTDAEHIRTFLAQWKKIDAGSADKNVLRRVNDYLADLKKAAGVK